MEEMKSNMSMLGLENTDMHNYINKLVNELRSDIEVYEQLKALNLTVGEVKENIARLTDFKEDYNYCKKCPGIDKCDKRTPHLQIKILKEGNYISSNYEPCSKILEKIKIDNKYLCADFPEEWKYSSLKTLDKSAARKPVIKEFASILKGSSFQWLYLIGNHNIGKSFTLVTFANEYANMKNTQVAVVSTPNLVKSLAEMAYSDKDEFSKQMVLLSDVNLLVMDDFGSEYKNEFIRDNIIFPLLNDRAKKNKLTFFASDFTLDEIKKLYSIGKNSGEIMGKQLWKLLKNMCFEEYDLHGIALY